jgi:protein-disulfide isomerase-like protein with CxxC motif
VPDALAVYYDYTCTYSYRAMHWLDRVPGVSVDWKTFSLKEVNRKADEPSFVEADSPHSRSIFALALAHAAREADFDRYHRAVFEAMHAEERRLTDSDLLGMAASAGVDVEAFEASRGSWVARVGAEHRDAVARWGAYGTPTLILDGAAGYVQLAEVPGREEAALDLLGALNGIASSPATLAEIFRPRGPKPTPIQIGTPE